MPCGWEGNRRSGVAQAMRHRLQWFIHLRAHGLRKGDVHPAYTPHGVWHSFTILPRERIIQRKMYCIYRVGQKSKLLYCDRYFQGYTIVLTLNIL